MDTLFTQRLTVTKKANSVFIERVGTFTKDSRNMQIRRKDYERQPEFDKEIIPYFTSFYLNSIVVVPKEYKSIRLFLFLVDPEDNRSVRIVEKEKEYQIVWLDGKISPTRITDESITVNNVYFYFQSKINVALG